MHNRRRTKHSDALRAEHGPAGVFVFGYRRYLEFYRPCPGQAERKGCHESPERFVIEHCPKWAEREGVIKSTKMFKALLGGVILLVGFALTGQALAQGGTWETKAPMPTARTVTAGGVIDNRLYVVGGGGAVGGSTNVNEVYDPGTDSWATKAPGLTSWAFPVGVVIDEKFYVLGGCIGSDCRIGTTNQLEMYNPAQDAWVTKSAMPTARAQVAAAAVGGKLYVVGGFSACPPCFPQFGTLEVYDPANDTWDTKTSMPTPREGASAAAIGNRLYVVGGCVRSVPSGACPATDKLEVYDPVTDSWTTKASMPTPRIFMGVAVNNGQLHTVGGDGGGGSIVAIHEVYNPTTDTWTTDTSMPAPRVFLVAEVINSRLYVVGGVDNTGAILNTLEVFTPTV